MDFRVSEQGPHFRESTVKGHRINLSSNRYRIIQLQQRFRRYGMLLSLLTTKLSRSCICLRNMKLSCNKGRSMIVTMQSSLAVVTNLVPLLSMLISPHVYNWVAYSTIDFWQPNTYFTDNCNDFKYVNHHLPLLAHETHG